MTIKSNELFPISFNRDFKLIMNHDFTEFVEAGGRGSCKSSFLSICIILLIMQNKNYNALVVRKVSNTLRDSVYTQLKWAVDKLGVSHLFNFTLTPLQATYTPTGQVIFFRGADDPLKIKSIKAPSGYIAVTWFEEQAEFQRSDIETIKLSTMRGGDKYWILSSYNPPSSLRSWVNEENIKPKSNRFFHKSSYLTVPQDWLGDAFIFEAEQMMQRNKRLYDNIFLGEPTGTGSNVFENIEIRTITDEEINSFEFNYFGCDWGFYPDPFRFVACSYSIKTKELYIYAELSLNKTGNEETGRILKQFMQDKGIEWTERITADSAEPKSIADFRDYGFNMRGAIKGKGSREASFKWLQSKKIVIDAERCPFAADEFSLYEYEIDKRNGDIIGGYPDGQPDHSIDAVRYSLEQVWTKKGL